MIPLLVYAVFAQTSFQPLNHKPLPPSSNDFWFVALGDNRPAGAGLPPTRTFRELIEEVSIIDPAFVISSGDLLYGNEETVDQYRQEVKWMKPLLDSMPCAFFNAPGNHEINNRPEFMKEYIAAFGPLYGSFEFGGIRFVGVCTEVPAEKPSIFGDQLTWLQKLATEKKPTVYFEHHPIFPRASNAEKETAGVANAAELHALYRDSGAVMVLEGHDHIYDAQMHDGVDYRIAGGAGAPLDGATKDGGYFHFLLVHAHDGKLDSTPIPSGTLEVVPISDGVVAVADYAYADLPLNNVRITSKFEPKSVKADYTSKTGKTKSVDATIVRTTKVGDHFETQVSLLLTRAKATFVRLGK